MRELIANADGRGDGTAHALGIIARFDRLLENRVTLAALTRAAASAAGCPAGIRDGNSLRGHRCTRDGAPLMLDAAAPGSRRRVPGRAELVTWLEDQGIAVPFGDLILERFALAASALVGASPISADSHLTSDALIRIALAEELAENDRIAAARRVGLPDRTTVIFTDREMPQARWSARFGAHTVILTAPHEVPELERAGSATADTRQDLAAALQRARLAFELTDRPEGPGRSVIEYDDLGAWAAVLSRITPDAAGRIDDVVALEACRIDHPWLIDTLQAITDHVTLRQAARVLHLHHSSLQERLDRLSNLLPFEISSPPERSRAALALILWRHAHR